MPFAPCPTCGTLAEFDFQPVAGGVWCHECKKLFLPTDESDPEKQKTKQNDSDSKRDGEGS